MKTKLFTLGALVGAAVAANAAVISINITNGDAPRQIGATESTGVINTTGWNNVSALSTTNIDGTGVNATLSRAINSLDKVNTLRDSGIGDGTDGFLALYEAGLRDTTNNTSRITLDNMAAFMGANGASDYRIIAYYKSPVTSGNRAFRIRVGASAGTGTYVTTNTPDWADVSVNDSFVKLGSGDNNWMEFTGLTSDTAVVEIDRTSRDGILAGIQIEAIPEPSTTALLGLGGLALILRRRK